MNIIKKLLKLLKSLKVLQVMKENRSCMEFEKLSF